MPKYHWELWHSRMGHVARELLKQIEASSTGIRIDEKSWVAHAGCANCKAGNMLTWKNEDLEIRDRAARSTPHLKTLSLIIKDHSAF